MPTVVVAVAWTAAVWALVTVAVLVRICPACAPAGTSARRNTTAEAPAARLPRAKVCCGGLAAAPEQAAQVVPFREYWQLAAPAGRTSVRLTLLAVAPPVLLTRRVQVRGAPPPGTRDLSTVFDSVRYGGALAAQNDEREFWLIES